jgi:hypothetical protein
LESPGQAVNLFENTLRDLLIASNLFATRVFLIRAPQVPAEKQQWPYAIFFHVAPTPMHDQCAPLTLLTRDYQVSIFDPSQSKALALADALRTYLDGYKAEYRDVLFGGIFYVTQVSAYEPDTQLFHIVQEYRLQFKLLPVTRTATQPVGKSVTPTGA